MKFHFRIYSLICCVLLFVNLGLAAKDFDTTLEKPEEKVKPDNHRIFLRMLSGDGSMTTPAQEELRGLYNAATVASFAAGDPSVYTVSFGQSSKSAVTATAQLDLEYRYLDKFRIFYEKRTITKDFSYFSVVASSFNLSNVPIEYTDTQKRFGFAYFHPILPMLNIGLSLRRVELEQLTETNAGTLRSAQLRSYGALLNSVQTVKMNGYVPGIGLEFKPLSWFEIHLQHLNYNLKGNDNRSELFFDTLGSRDITLGGGNATYRGYSQTIDFVFRYSSWFSTRWGYTRESFLKTNGVFLFPNEVNPTAAIATSLFVQAFSEASVKYGSYNFTIEFSKGFGGN